MNKKLLDCGFYICNIIGSTINKNVKLNREFSSTRAIKEFSKEHHLDSILGCISQKSHIDSIKDFENAVNNSIFKQMKFDIIGNQISENFSKLEIKHIFLKGSEIQKFYPEYIIRSSSDIDIFVDKISIEKASQVMYDNGFSLYAVNKNEEFQFHKQPRYNIELHTTLEGFSDKEKDILIKLKNNALVVNKYRYTLTDSDCYIHAMFHLYKHFILSGVGVRMFLDIYMMNKNGDINFSYTDKIFKTLGIDGFCETVCKINRVLFENETACDEITEVIEFIFNSGIYGKTSIHQHLSEINRTTTDMSKLQLFFRNYGISFSAMSKRYPILKKAPVLYPFSFVHRLIYGLTYRRDTLKNDRLKKKSLSDEKIEKYRRIFKTTKIKM